MSDLKLYGDASWESLWSFHAMVALEELGVPYTLELLELPIAPTIREELRTHAMLGKTPCLVHGTFWLTESSAISEYLAETFSPPHHPPLMPRTVEQRARARQVMSWLRTSSMALREARPTTSVFWSAVTSPLTPRAQADADDVIRCAERLLPVGQTHMFDEWSIADVDLALMLMRLVKNGDPVPQRLADYALAQWDRRSVRAYLGRLPAKIAH